MLIAAFLAAQDAAASRASRTVELPRADQAKEIARQVLIVVEVFRPGEAPAAAAAGDPLAAWRVGLSAQTYDVTEPEFGSRFAAHLARLAKANSGKDAGVLVRADAKAPATFILRALDCVATAGLSRVLLEVQAAKGSPRRAVECRLPREEDPPDPDGLPEIRIRVGVDRDSRVQRVFEVNPKLIPAGAEGDERLEKLLRIKHEDYTKLWKAQIPVVIESTAMVPWRDVVDIVNLTLRVGAQRIEFAAAPELPKEVSRRADPPRPPVEPSAGEPASRPTPGIEVPAAAQAVAFDEQDAVEVWVFRDDSAPAPSSRGAPAYFDGWRLQLGTTRMFATDAAGFRGLEVQLALRAGVKFPKASQRSLLIRADANAPWGIVAPMLVAAATARFYKIHFGATRDPSGGRQALPCWLPMKKKLDDPDAPSLDEIRVLMSWNPAANRLERLFGQQLVPATPEGAARLEVLVRAAHERHQTEGRDVPMTVDAGPRVPFRHLVEVVDLARKAGITQVVFGGPSK